MRKVLSLLCMLADYCLSAQEMDFAIGHPAYQLIELKEIRTNQSFSATIKPVSRKSTFDLFGTNGGAYLNKELRSYTYDSARSTKPIFKKLV